MVQDKAAVLFNEWLPTPRSFNIVTTFHCAFPFPGQSHSGLGWHLLHTHSGRPKATLKYQVSEPQAKQGLSGLDGIVSFCIKVPQISIVVRHFKPLSKPT